MSSQRCSKVYYFQKKRNTMGWCLSYKCKFIIHHVLTNFELECNNIQWQTLNASSVDLQLIALCTTSSLQYISHQLHHLDVYVNFTPPTQISVFNRQIHSRTIKTLPFYLLWYIHWQKFTFLPGINISSSKLNPGPMAFKRIVNNNRHLILHMERSRCTCPSVEYPH